MKAKFGLLWPVSTGGGGFQPVRLTIQASTRRTYSW
jgi:hypothetical protein